MSDFINPLRDVDGLFDEFDMKIAQVSGFVLGCIFCLVCLLIFEGYLWVIQ